MTTTTTEITITTTTGHEAVLDRGSLRVSIYTPERHWAGEGRWDRVGGTVVDCPAALPDEVYEEIDDLLAPEWEAAEQADLEHATA